jgi:hypothetical protein
MQFCAWVGLLNPGVIDILDEMAQAVASAYSLFVANGARRVSVREHRGFDSGLSSRATSEARSRGTCFSPAGTRVPAAPGTTRAPRARKMIARRFNGGWAVRYDRVPRGRHKGLLPPFANPGRKGGAPGIPISNCHPERRAQRGVESLPELAEGDLLSLAELINVSLRPTGANEAPTVQLLCPHQAVE